MFKRCECAYCGREYKSQPKECRGCGSVKFVYEDHRDNYKAGGPPPLMSSTGHENVLIGY